MQEREFGSNTLKRTIITAGEKCVYIQGKHNKIDTMVLTNF